MSQPAVGHRSSPRRKTTSLAERNTNLDADNATLPMTRKDKAKKRATFSMGGEGLKKAIEEGFQVGATGTDDLTPKKRARRSLKPRKSILKSFASNLALDESDETTDFSAQNMAHTIAFSTSGLSRRVSFAPNAHVRMFEKDKEKEARFSDPHQPFPMPPAATAPRASVNAPRASFAPSPARPTTSQASTPNRNQYVDVGGVAEEMSMAEASDSDEGDDDGGVQMGPSATSSQGQVLPDRQISFAVQQQQQQQQDADVEDDEDMEETQNYGGIRRQSMAPTDAGSEVNASFSTDGGKSTDDERTMDFTIAVGRVLPTSPPLGASRNRASMGYSVPMSPRTAGNRIHPGDRSAEASGDMSIEETVVIGGIIEEEDTVSTVSDANNSRDEHRTMTFNFGQMQAQIGEGVDSPGMDMTIAIGGISALPPHASSAPPRTGISPAARRSYTSITIPSPAVQSFARPTLSSSRKASPAKRNVFAPSPSPFKSMTPRKTSLTTAAEVAKRLSFSSVNSSAGKKRAREDDVESAPGTAKKARPTPPLTPAEEVFGGSSSSRPIPAAGPTPSIAFAPRVSLGKPSRTLPPRSPGESLAPPTPRKYGEPPTPRKSLGTPSRTLKSPRSLRQMRNELVDDEKLAVEEEDEVPSTELPPEISLDAFLEMAGVPFNESLPRINNSKRESLRKSLLAQSQNSMDREYFLHEYAESHIQEVFYNVYRWANISLRKDINQRHADLAEREKSCAEYPPDVIKEYLAASDEDKALFETTLQEVKVNTMLCAKAFWYSWRTETMENCLPSVQEHLDAQKEDQIQLQELDNQVDGLLPDLRARALALEQELAKEKATIAEIAECDPLELEELHIAMDEQANHIKEFTKDYEESKRKLDDLEKKLSELSVRKRDCESAIRIASSKCDQHTRSDVHRLREAYLSLQHLHLWRSELASSTELELIFDDELRLLFACQDHVPDIASANVDLLDKIGKKGSRYSQEATDGIFALFGEAMKMMMGMDYTSLSAFVQRIGQLWTACQRLRSELGVLALRYRLTYDSEESGVIISTTMMIPSERTKAKLYFHLEPDLLFDWPAGIANVQVSGSTVYGPTDPEVLSATAAETLRSASGSTYLGAFLQACVDANAQY